MKPSLVSLLFSLLVLTAQARASVLTFEIFDPGLNRPPYNDPGVEPFLSEDYGYPEGFGIPGDYGDRIAAAQVPASPGPGDVIYRYGVDEGLTPNVVVSYGPSSIFTGGPNLWREGYGDLNGILYQGSEGAIGNDYDILDIVLIGDEDWDVVLHRIDLGHSVALNGADVTIDNVTVYDGVPFPFLTPTNQIYEQFDVPVPSFGRNTIDFGGLQSHVIWLRIDATNLGDDSVNVGVDNIVFSQVFNDASEPVDLDEIEDALLPPEVISGVPEATSLLVWLVGGSLAAGVGVRRMRRPGDA